jgi:hypothetical protein
MYWRAYRAAGSTPYVRFLRSKDPLVFIPSWPIKLAGGSSAEFAQGAGVDEKVRPLESGAEPRT